MIDDNTKVVSDTAPKFEIDEKIFLFVAEKEPDSIYGDNYYVAGLELGKYNLNDGEANREKINEKQSERDLVSKIKSIRGL